jgi:glycosyltransferase involved in cell wall biosynthesis
MSQFNVSVIIPTFNRPAYLLEAVRSVLDQKHPVFEIIVIDNCSDAGHLDAYGEIAHFHDSIRLIRLQSNRGPGYARNSGITASKGDWILFLDDDDLLSSDYLVNCFESLSLSEDADIIIGRAISFISGGALSCPVNYIGAANPGSYMKDPVSTLLINGMAVGSCMVRRDLIGSLRFREDFWHGEDQIFWFSLMRKVKVVATAENAVVGIRQHDERVSLMKSSSNPDGSPAQPIETYVRIMIDSMEEQNPWLLYLLNLVSKRVADGSWFSLSMTVQIMRRPLYGVRILIRLLGKGRNYTHGIPLLGRLPKNNIPDFARLQYR